jgi:hypothetical protein
MWPRSGKKNVAQPPRADLTGADLDVANRQRRSWRRGRHLRRPARRAMAVTART